MQRAASLVNRAGAQEMDPACFSGVSVSGQEESGLSGAPLSEGVWYFVCFLSAWYNAGHLTFILKCDALRGFILLFSFGSETDFQRDPPGWFSRKL